MEQDKYRIVDVTEPHGLQRTIRNHWWWALDGDPKQAVFYTGGFGGRTFSPQCNSDRRIVDSLGVPFANAQVVQVPLAFVPVRD